MKDVALVSQTTRSWRCQTCHQPWKRETLRSGTLRLVTKSSQVMSFAVSRLTRPWSTSNCRRKATSPSFCSMPVLKTFHLAHPLPSSWRVRLTLQPLPTMMALEERRPHLLHLLPQLRRLLLHQHLQLLHPLLLTPIISLLRCQIFPQLWRR